MGDQSCPEVARDIIAGSGLHALGRPFTAPEVGGQTAEPLCVWKMVFFLSEDCPPCKFQLDTLRAAFEQRFADVSKLSFVSVWPGTVTDAYAAERSAAAADPLPSAMARTGVGGVTPELDLALGLGLRIVSDESGRLSERFAVSSYPFVALVDHQGLVRGFWPGVLRLDAPGFERLSHVIAGRSERGLHPSVPLVCGVLAVLCLLALTTFALRSVVRKRRPVLYGRQIS